MSDKFSIRWRSISIVFMLAIVFCLQSCKVEDKHGAATPDRIVEQYLLALENRDDALLRRLAPEDAVIGSEIKTKISKIGGHKIKDRQVSYTKFRPTFWAARIRGFYLDRTGKRHNFDDSIEIEYQSKGQVKLYGGSWYLLLKNK
jgi:hypothetical protein